jgi:hypothetical protein
MTEIGFDEYAEITEDIIQDLLGYIKRGTPAPVLKVIVERTVEGLNIPKSETDFFVDLAFERYLTEIVD